MGPGVPDEDVVGVGDLDGDVGPYPHGSRVNPPEIHPVERDMHGQRLGDALFEIRPAVLVTGDPPDVLDLGDEKSPGGPPHDRRISIAVPEESDLERVQCLCGDGAIRVCRRLGWVWFWVQRIGFWPGDEIGGVACLASRSNGVKVELRDPVVAKWLAPDRQHREADAESGPAALEDRDLGNIGDINLTPWVSGSRQGAGSGLTRPMSVSAFTGMRMPVGESGASTRPSQTLASCTSGSGSTLTHRTLLIYCVTVTDSGAIFIAPSLFCESEMR